MRKITNEELHRPSVEEFAAMPKLPLVVVLDNVRSAQNVGSFFRTGDAFAVERIALCGITAVPPCRELHKTALGAEQSVAWTHHASTVECIDGLRAAGYRVLAVEQVEGAAMLDALAVDPQARYALVFGNEVEGVSQEAVDRCDGAVEIPQLGTKHSLNVGRGRFVGILLPDSLKSVTLPAKNRRRGRNAPDGSCQNINQNRRTNVC